MSANESPASNNTLRVAGAGVKPWRAAAASSASSKAQAPSFTPDAFPAVTVPWGAHDALKPRQSFQGRFAGVFVAAHDHSASLLLGDRHRHDLSVEKPLLCAASALCCERSAMRSRASRSIRKSVATFSAVSGMESTP